MAQAKQYPDELLTKADAFVARQREIDPKLGRFASGEAHTAYEQGRLAEWLAEVTA